MTKYRRCEGCDGTGMMKRPSYEDCPDCDGHGIVDKDGYPPLEEEEDET